MDKIKLDSKYIFPIVVGIFLLVTDFVFGWLTFILGPIPMLFVLSLVVGFLTRNVEDAVNETIMSIAIGLGICGALRFFVSGAGASGSETILDSLFYVAIYSTRGPFIFLSSLSSIGDAIFFLVFLFTPFHYFFAPGFATIGVKISELFRNNRMKNDDGLKTLASEVLEPDELVHGADSTN